MTPDKAIELLKLYEHAASSISREDFLEATKLGIEALERELEYRESMPLKGGELLPSETVTD